MTVGWSDSILGQIGETARCRDANFFYIICQHCEQTAGPICMKLSGMVWSDLVTFWSIPRNRAMRNTGTGFVVLSHHSLLLCVMLMIDNLFSDATSAAVAVDDDADLFAQVLEFP